MTTDYWFMRVDSVGIGTITKNGEQLHNVKSIRVSAGFGKTTEVEVVFSNASVEVISDEVPIA